MGNGREEHKADDAVGALDFDNRELHAVARGRS